MFIDGTALSTLKDRELTLLRREKVGFVFQTFNLIPTLDAEENILLPLSIAREGVERDWFNQIVQTLGLDDRLTHLPTQLSGGQQQRVAVARALISRPIIVCANEPTGNLDSRASDELLGFIREAVDEGADLDETQQRVQDMAADYPLIQIQTKSELAADFENQIGQLVAVFNGLLALAIVIAILGITNTLALSITERIREIGTIAGRRNGPPPGKPHGPLGGGGSGGVRRRPGRAAGRRPGMGGAVDPGRRRLRNLQPSHNPTAHLRSSGRCSRGDSRHPPRPLSQPHQDPRRHRLRIGRKNICSGECTLSVQPRETGFPKSPRRPALRVRTGAFIPFPGSDHVCHERGPVQKRAQQESRLVIPDPTMTSLIRGI